MAYLEQSYPRRDRGFFVSINTLQKPASLLIFRGQYCSKNQDLKFNPMRQEFDSINTPARVFLKLTVFGFVLIGFAYVSLVVPGTALKAIH